MKCNWVFAIAVLCCLSVKAQHSFNGYIDNERWQNEVYLSVVDDYRKIFAFRVKCEFSLRISLKKCL